MRYWGARQVFSFSYPPRGLHALTPHCHHALMMVKGVGVAKKNLSQGEAASTDCNDLMFPLWAGFGTFLSAGCRAVIGPDPSRLST